MTEAIYYYRYDGYKHAKYYAYQVTKRTPKGVWISLGYDVKEKFILYGAKRRWAYPNKEMALESFRIRKERQIMHSNDSIKKANMALIAVGLNAIDPQSQFNGYDDGEFYE